MAQPKNLAFDLIGLTDLRNDPRFSNFNGTGFSVAVIDSGLDKEHPILKPNYKTGFDFINNDDNPIDNDGHGTHVAGIIGAQDTIPDAPSIGVAPGVGLIGLQVFDGIAGGSAQDIQTALEWVLENRDKYNITAVNMSLGGGFYTKESEAIDDFSPKTVKALEQAGITVVSAAGNNYEYLEKQGVDAPGIFSSLLVGSLDAGISNKTTAGDFSVFSQRLQAANMLFAPGADILSSIPTQENNKLGLTHMSGTSMATPHVAGTVSLLQQASWEFGGRNLATNTVVSQLIDTAVLRVDNKALPGSYIDSVPPTNQTYPSLNIYNAVTNLKERFDSFGDVDGTLTGADLFWSPVLELEKNSVSFTGSIGVDGKQKPVGTKDVDLFRFQVISAGKLIINTASNPFTPQDFDTFLRLFDAQGQEIAANNDDGTSQFSQIADFVINPGFYYAAVSSNGNQSYSSTSTSNRNDGATGNYLLNLNFQPADTNGIIYRATPVTLAPNSLPIVIDEQIGSDQNIIVENIADVDLFKVAMPDNGVFTININTPNVGYIDSFIRLFDTNGNPLQFDGVPAENDNDRATDTEFNYKEFTDPLAPKILVDRNNNFVGNITDSAMSFSTSKGAIYYIGVSATDNRTYDPNTTKNRPSSSATGQYQIEFNFDAYTGLPPTQNNTTIKDIDGSITLVNDLAPIILPLLNQPGSIGTDINPQTNESVTPGNKDVDFVKISVANAGLLAAKVSSKTNPNIQQSVSTNLWLFDAEGNNIFGNTVLEPESEPTDPHIVVPIEANKDYYLAVSGIGNDNFDPNFLASGSDALETGDYLLNAEILTLSSLNNYTDNKLSDQGIIDVSIGDEIYGDIGTDGLEDKFILVGEEDIDIYRLTPTMTGQIKIRTDIDVEDGADTNLRFFDSQEQQIDANDDEDNTTYGSALVVDVIAGQTYYIGVNGYSEQKDDYTLSGEGVVAADSDSLGSYILSLLTLQDINIAGTENTEIVFTTADFITVIDDFEDDILQSLKVLSLPGAGTLSLNGKVVTAGQDILPDQLGNLRYTPAPDANGKVSFTVAATNGTDSSDPATVTLNLAAVNDAPSFTLLDSPSQVFAPGENVTIPSFATNISPGAENEASQTLTFNLEVTGDEIFAASPTLDPVTGDLGYILADAIGTATISLTLSDNGGIDNGGVNTSSTQSFTVSSVGEGGGNVSSVGEGGGDVSSVGEQGGDDSREMVETIFTTLENQLIDGLVYDTSRILNRTNITANLVDDGQNLRSDAKFDNLIGLYQVVGVDGGIDTNGDGKADLLPGDKGYALAAIENRVDDFMIRAGSSGDPNFNTTAKDFGDVLLEGGRFYAPFVIANGGNVGFEGFISQEQGEADGEFNDAADFREDLVAYFTFGAANPDGQLHLQNRGNGVFGFEDLPGNLASSDNDFNDGVFQLKFS